MTAAEVSHEKSLDKLDCQGKNNVGRRMVLGNEKQQVNSRNSGNKGT